MLKPLTYMALVLTLFTPVVLAQPIEENPASLCLIQDNAQLQKVALPVPQKQTSTLHCDYPGTKVSLPKYLQFGCSGGNSVVTVQITITDGQRNQIIFKDIPVDASVPYYEMQLQNYVAPELLETGVARVKSIAFVNNSDANRLVVNEIAFAKSSFRYEVRLDQIFTMEISSNVYKKVVIQSAVEQPVMLNVYNASGEFNQKISINLKKGENILPVDQMKILPGKYVAVITTPSSTIGTKSKLTVMY